MQPFCYPLAKWSYCRCYMLLLDYFHFLILVISTLQTCYQQVCVVPSSLSAFQLISLLLRTPGDTSQAWSFVIKWITLFNVPIISLFQRAIFSLELGFPLYDLFSVHCFYSVDSSSRYFTWVSQLSHVVENKNLLTHPLFKKKVKKKQHLFTQHLNKQAREQRPGKITLGCRVSMNV